MKFNAIDVANEMEVLMDGNEYVFEPYQWLKPSQIQSFWSRLTRNRRRSSQQQTLLDNDRDETNEDDTDDRGGNDLFEDITYEVEKTLLQRNSERVQSSRASDQMPLEVSLSTTEKKIEFLI